LNQETIKNFWINGYAIFNEIYDPDTITVMKEEMADFVENYNFEKEKVEFFSSKKRDGA
jgi:hypothetical protein